MYRIICLLIGYLIGCIQTAYITGKLAANIDIREHGSGSAGFTNVTRVIGAHAGIFVFVIDVLKGIVTFMLCTLIFNGGSSFFTGGATGLLPGLYGGFGVLLGHNYPFYLKFKGGKGIASSLGVILCLNLPAAFIIYISGIAAIAITKFVSVGSLLMLLMLPVLMAVFGLPVEAIVICVLMTAMAFYQHRTNIKRLMNGNENKFSFKKKKA